MEYDEFLRAACPALDLRWRKYRRRSARRRVRARMEELGLADYRDYLECLRSDPEEARGFADRARVTVSRFFRERARWERLVDRVIPELLESRGGETTLRVWSVGCCNGEEPYTLAILWLDRVQPGHLDRSLEVLATDIDSAVLARAREASYQTGTLREVRSEFRERWFTREGRLWRVQPRAAALVRFDTHNLLEDLPPRGMDLVLCRYLAFTYFTGERRYGAARRLWEALRPGGALMIGRKEGLGPRELTLFEPWPGADGVFRRTGARANWEPGSETLGEGAALTTDNR